MAPPYGTTIILLKWFSVGLIRLPWSKVRLEAVSVLRSSSLSPNRCRNRNATNASIFRCSRNMFSGRFTIFEPSVTHAIRGSIANTSKRNINSVSFSFSSASTQVHTRITYLRHLIVSLAQAKDISKTLLIFSHDFYDEDINDLVQTIDFCKVLQVKLLVTALPWQAIPYQINTTKIVIAIQFMQIFYPYSIQTHEHEFPGEDPGDCPRDIKRDQ